MESFEWSQDPWYFVKKYVCAICLGLRANVQEANSLLEQRHLMHHEILLHYKLHPKLLELVFPEEATCCIHSLESHLLEWILSLHKMGDKIALSEICLCAEIAIKQLQGEPFISSEWVVDFLDRNSNLKACIEDRMSTLTVSNIGYHVALGEHENTFKMIIALVGSLGIHLRKADLTLLAKSCKTVLNWESAFSGGQSPGLSWCRRFVTRYPEVAQHLYATNKIASFTQIDSVQLVTLLKPHIEAGRDTLQDYEKQFIISSLPSILNNQNTDDTDEPTPVHEENSIDVFTPPNQAANTSHYSSPNKYVRNSIIEDVLKIMFDNKTCTRRDEMRAVVKIIADIFGWKTVYENNLPSKSWTLRFMTERPHIKEYIEKCRINCIHTKSDPKEFYDSVVSALEESEKAHIHYPQFYSNVD